MERLCSPLKRRGSFKRRYLFAEQHRDLCDEELRTLTRQESEFPESSSLTLLHSCSLFNINPTLIHNFFDRFHNFLTSSTAPLDPCYHESCDTVANVDTQCLSDISQASSTVVWDLATNTNLRQTLLLPPIS